jgi:ketosteroid isomerase-like protein
MSKLTSISTAGVTMDSEEVRIRVVIDALATAHRIRDAHMLGELYDKDAVIADLAPPLLSRGLDVGGAQAWLDGWDGPVEVEFKDIVIRIHNDLALAFGLKRTKAVTQDGEVAEWWSRITLGLARTPEGWRIMHEHDSVPFHMDGSFRAAVDLVPGGR